MSILPAVPMKDFPPVGCFDRHVSCRPATQFSRSETTNNYPIMSRTILSIAIIIALSGAYASGADPKTSSKQKSKKEKSSQATNSVPTPAPSGNWSLVNGVWSHSDGYKFVNGQVVRSSVQTHRPKPKPPTQADLDAATKTKSAPKTPADLAKEKAAQRERNLNPRPASQTGSHL